MPILKKLKLKRKNIKSGCFNNPFLILIGILLIAVIIVILYHYFYKKSNTIERFYQKKKASAPAPAPAPEPVKKEEEWQGKEEGGEASDENCESDIKGKEWKKRNEYMTYLEKSVNLDALNKCCVFNSNKEENDSFKGYNMHCEAAFAKKLKNCINDGTGKDDEGNCPIESGGYKLTYKSTNTGDGNAWRYRPQNYLVSA